MAYIERQRERRMPCHGTTSNRKPPHAVCCSIPPPRVPRRAIGVRHERLLPPCRVLHSRINIGPAAMAASRCGAGASMATCAGVRSKHSFRTPGCKLYLTAGARLSEDGAVSSNLPDPWGLDLRKPPAPPGNRASRFTAAIESLLSRLHMIAQWQQAHAHVKNAPTLASSVKAVAPKQDAAPPPLRCPNQRRQHNH